MANIYGSFTQKLNRHYPRFYLLVKGSRIDPRKSNARLVATFRLPGYAVRKKIFMLKF